MSAIGLDIGHSAVKVAAGGSHTLFPTAAFPAVELSVEEAARAAKAETVRVNGQDYFVGQTALVHSGGRVLEGLADNWIETPEHIALLIAGYRRGLDALEGDEDPILMLGLPSRLHKAQQKRLQELAIMHLSIPQSQVRVLPQPLAAFMSLILDEHGDTRPDRDLTQERWGVIDIGYYTTDYGLIQGGQWSHAGARSSAGANVVAEQLQQRLAAQHAFTFPLRACEEMLRIKRAKLYGKTLDVSDDVDVICDQFARQVIEGAAQVLAENLPQLDGILVAGGGADLVFPAMKKEWPHALIAPTPRFSIAEGLRRYGLLLLKRD